MRTAAWIMVAALAGCQGPFGADRHDLVRDRIAAVVADGAGDTVHPRAVLVQGGRLWADSPPSFAWFWLDTGASIDEVDPADAVATDAAPSLTRPSADAVLGLIVDFPSGAQRRAVLQVGDEPAPAFASVAVESVPIDFEEPTDLSIEARATLTPTPAPDPLPVGAWLRITPTFSVEPGRVRWMSTADTSTFLALDEQVTDWATGEVVIDDGEVEEASPLAPGVHTLMALALSDGGRHAVYVEDRAVGAPVVAARVGGRLLGAETALAPGRYAATLQADDDLPSGLRLASPTPSSGALTGPPCADGEGVASALLTGRCGRDAVIGASVVVEVE